MGPAAARQLEIGRTSQLPAANKSQTKYTVE